MKLNFYRHGMTIGNQNRRYVGTTDEPLCGEGRAALWGITVPQADLLYVSPMIRCLETANILYPGQAVIQVKGFSECDFGIFEYKNFEELNGRKDYQEWIDAGGKAGFPKGETLEAFKGRVIDAFESIAEGWIKHEYHSAAFVVHGGTIMSFFDNYAVPHQDYFEWQVKNGHGFQAELSIKQWVQGKKELTRIIKH